MVYARDTHGSACAAIICRVINIAPSGGAPVSQAPPSARDADQSDARRDFSLRSVFGVAFAFISPIIALYAIFNLGVLTAGPSFWWAFPVVLAGQTLVALVFGELSSRWPEEGGVFAWARRLGGGGVGWVAGWGYSWTLVCLNAAAAFAASSFAIELLGLDSSSNVVRLALAAGFIVLATLVNCFDRRLLKAFIAVSISCEVIGSLYVGTVLLVFHRNNDFSSLVSGFSDGGSSFLTGPFLAAVALAGWALIGFESAADLAAEVRDPERSVPLAQIASLVLVAATVMYACAGLILAVPDWGAVTSGDVGDAIMDTISAEMGASLVTPIMVVVCIGFLAGIAAVSAALSRSVHAMATHRALPGAEWLSRHSVRDELPRNALVLTSVLTVALLIFSVWAGFYDVMISMSTGGFYIAFLIPVLALLWHRSRGLWQPGVFRLGRASLAVNVAAAIWLTFEVINISWPRDIGLAWYVEWGCLLMYGVLGVLGAIVYLSTTRGDVSTDAAATPQQANND
ncbi:APC family permease [Nocardioides immobilis]|nr:APC family permease [Nocardioides immobilis]